MFFNYIKRNQKSARKENGIYYTFLVVVIVAFYVVLALEQQDVMKFLKKMESDAVNRLFGLISGIYIISLFFLFFLIYFATKYQLSRREREFGVMMMLGMKRGRLFGWLMMEDLYSSMIVLVAGIPVAVLLSEVLSLTTAKLIGKGILGHQFSVSLRAIGLTIIGFAGIKMLANMILSMQIIKKEPGHLLEETQEKKQKVIKIKHSVFFLVLGICLLAVAYTLAILGFTWCDTRWLLLTMLLGSVGTFAVFKGICAIFQLVMRKQKPKEVLHRFTCRQLQENVFLRSGSLTLASLLVLLAVACMAYGIAVIISYSSEDTHSMDVTVTAYEEEQTQKLVEFAKKETSKKYFADWVQVKVAYIDSADMQEGEGGYVYDAAEWTKALTTLDEKERDTLGNMYYSDIPHIIALSGYNDLRRQLGKEPITLQDKEIAIYQDDEFYSQQEEQAFLHLLKQNPKLVIGEEAFSMKPEIFHDEIVVDRAITLSFAIILPDDKFTKYASALNTTSYWNGYMQEHMIKEYGLMQALEKADNELQKEHLEHENYLQNMGRQLFFIVASSYVTIYLALIFLLIANTVISMQYLMQEEKTRKRYHTLLCLGSDYDQLYESSRKQIVWYFGLPLSVGVISSIFGVCSFFTAFLPSALRGDSKHLMLLAGIVILVLGAIEVIYMKMVVRVSKRNLYQIAK